MSESASANFFKKVSASVSASAQFSEKSSVRTSASASQGFRVVSASVCQISIIEWKCECEFMKKLKIECESGFLTVPLQRYTAILKIAVAVYVF